MTSALVSPTSCKFNHNNGTVDGVMLFGEVLAGNEAVETGDVAVAGGQSFYFLSTYVLLFLWG